MSSIEPITIVTQTILAKITAYLIATIVITAITIIIVAITVVVVIKDFTKAIIVDLETFIITITVTTIAEINSNSFKIIINCSCPFITFYNCYYKYIFEKYGKAYIYKICYI